MFIQDVESSTQPPTMIVHAVYAFHSPGEFLVQLWPSLKVPPEGGDVGCVLGDGGAVVFWSEDRLLACFGEQAVATVEKTLGLGKEAPPASNIDPTKSSAFGIGLQVALLDPLSSNPFTYIPRNAKGDFIRAVDPGDFWAIGFTSKGSVCIVAQQGKGNPDGTVRFEYTLPGEIFTAPERGQEQVEIRVFYRGNDVTPTTAIPLFVKCVLKDTPLPRPIISSRDWAFIFELNFALLRRKFRNTYLKDQFHKETATGKPVFYMDSEGFLRARAFHTFLVYTDNSQADKVSEMYGQSVDGIPFEITLESVPTARLLAATTWIAMQDRSCVLL